MTTSPTLAEKGFAPQALSILSYAILLGGIITVGFSAYIVVASYSSLPYWDGWAQIDFAANRDTSVLDWLWTQHNEHRLVISRLLMLADLHWFHARQVFLLSSIFAVLLLHVLLLGWSMRVVGGWRGSLWRTGVGVAAFCLLCPSLWEMLVWGECVCFALPGFFATLSLVGLMLYWMRSQDASRKRTSWKYLLLSIAAALCGTWSLLNGNLLWPLLLGAAALLRLRRAVVGYAIAGTLSSVAYLYDYIRPSYAANSIKTPAATVKYLATYFGSSWVSGNFHLAEVLGIAGLVVCFLVFLRLPAYVRSCRPFYVQLVLTMLFCAGTGLITALGRAGFGPSQASTSRYQTFALLFWCCLGLLLLGTVSSLRHGRDVAILLTQLVVLGIMLVGAKYAAIPLIQARVHGFKLNSAAMSLITNVRDTEQLNWVYRQPDYLFTLIPYMRRERLSVFDEPSSWVLGKPLESAFSLAPANECTGELESSVVMSGAAAGPPALRIAGWAWDYQHRQPPSLIVTATNGTINGLGAMGDWRPMNQTVRPGMTTNYIGYTGYVQKLRSPGPVEIYAILNGNPVTACFIATVK